MKWFDTDNRSSKILKILDKEKKVSGEYLAQKLEVGEKTIRNDINEINRRLGNTGLIDCKHGYYKLYVTNTSGYMTKKNQIAKENAYFESPQMRMAFIVDTLMNSDTPYLMDELAYAMNIGRTTLVGDIKKLKEILDFYDLKIQGKPNTGLTLEGDELNLRFFVFENIYHILYSENSIEEELIQIIKEETRNYQMDSIAVTYFQQFLSIALDRISENRVIDTFHEKYHEIRNDFSYRLVEKIGDRIEKKLNIKISMEERLFLTIPFVSMRTPTLVQGIEPYIEISEEILKLVDEIMNRIQEETGLGVQLNELLNEFIYHIYFMIKRLRYGFRVNNPMTEDIREKYGIAYKMAKIAESVIQERLELVLTLDEIGFLAAYFEVFISEQRNTQKENYKVAVVCGSGRATARLLLNKLKNIFGSETKLELFQDSQIEEETINNYDLIISTSKQIPICKVPKVYVDGFYDENHLKKKIDEVRYLNKLSIPLLKGMDSILLSLIDETTFFQLDRNKSYEENLHDMIDQLEEKGYIDTNFKKRIDEREKKSSMVFDELIAFPHGYQFSTDKVLVSLGVFPEKMEVGSHKSMKMILLVALPKVNEDDTVLIRIYDELIAIANDKKVVNDISKTKSHQELLTYFIKNSELFH